MFYARFTEILVEKRERSFFTEYFSKPRIRPVGAESNAFFTEEVRSYL